MSARRIIPCLDVKDGRVVKGVRFVGLRDAGDPVECAARYDGEGADEICFLDITASSDARRTLFEVVDRTAAALTVPLTVGGGVRTRADARDLLDAGADKVAVNTAAVKTPEVIEAIAGAYGSQALVVAIDARARSSGREAAGREAAGGWEVFTHGGRNATGLDAIAWARRVAELGAGEILLTSMDRDGTRDGYDLALTRAVSDAVAIPVIASGGVGTLDHFRAGLGLGAGEGGADAALAASVFHDGVFTVGECKRYLLAHGVRVRPPPDLRSARP